MNNSKAVPGVVGPFAGLDVPWLLKMRAEECHDPALGNWGERDARARRCSYGD